MEKLQHVRTGAGEGPIEENQKEWPEREEANQENRVRASLVAQWLGVRLPMRGARVRAPVREDPTCRR